MAFSIENLLKKKDSSSAETHRRKATERSQNHNAAASGGDAQFPANSSTFAQSTTSGSSVQESTEMPTGQIQLPTLADIQLLFGGGGPKAHYRRNRRTGADRKPRQAYSSKQLEKLEDEFKRDKYLSVGKRIDLSKSLGLSETQIKTWFQNRRTKWKKQMTANLRQLYRQGIYPQYPVAAGGPAAFLPFIAHQLAYAAGANQADFLAAAYPGQSNPWAILASNPGLKGLYQMQPDSTASTSGNEQPSTPQSMSSESGSGSTTPTL